MVLQQGKQFNTCLPWNEVSENAVKPNHADRTYHHLVRMVCRFSDAIRSGRIHHIEAIDNCCVLAAVGQQMASRKGVSATMFSALAKSNINIRYSVP